MKLNLINRILLSCFPFYTDVALASDTNLAFVNFEYTNQSISNDFMDYVARYGARTTMEAKPGSDLNAYVTAACGEPSERNTVLFERSLTLQGIVVEDNGLVHIPSNETTLALPPCLPIAKAERVPTFATPGARIWDYYSQAGKEGVLGIGFGPDGQARPVPVEEIVSSFDRNGSSTGAPMEVPSAQSSILAKYGIEPTELCPSTSAQNPCNFALVSDTADYEAIITKAMRAAAYQSTQPERLATDAFLVGNDFIREGADPVATVRAIESGLQTVATSDGAIDIADALKVAFKQYSGPQQGLPSSDWAELWDKQRVSAPTAVSYQDQFGWYVPGNEVRVDGRLNLGDMVLVPQPVKQYAQIPIDLAALKEDTGTPDVEANPPAITVDADADAADIGEQDAWPIFSANEYQCTSNHHHNWGGAQFFNEFLGALARSRVLAYVKGRKRTSINIKILDSGLVEQDDMGAFSDDVIGDNRPVRELQTSTQHMGDGYAHGTAVAGVALGGPELRNVLPALGIDIAIQPRRIYDGIKSGVNNVALVNYIRLGDAIREPGPIFNLSFASTDFDRIYSRFINGSKNKLLVVAAGNNHLNNGDQGVKIDGIDLYPQVWSGDPAWPNVLTVAALDGRKRATFSNWSDKKVLIAAPGCNVETWAPEDDGSAFRTSHFTGTSAAAPIVAYVAAIVTALAPDTKASASHVAMRLLASSDLLEELDGVVDGRALNPVKAVTLFEDVVELTGDNAGTLQVGDLRLTDGIADFCRSPAFPERANLLKVARLPGQQNDGQFVYYYERDGAFLRDTCEEINSTLEFVNSASGTKSYINTVDILDYVKRMQ